MSVATVRRSVLLVSAAAFVLAGCTVPRAEGLAGDTTAVVEDGIGDAPRWRSGADPTPEEDARVRALLAQPLEERGALDVALVRSRRLQALVERAIADALAAYADAAPSNPVLDLLVRWPHVGGGPLIDAGATFGLLDVLRIPGRRDAAGLAARASALDAADEIVHALAEVRMAWVEAVAACEREALDADVAETASIAADLAGRQQTAGTIARFDADRLRAFRDETIVSRERARADSAAAVERLVRALGVFGEEARIAVPASLPPLAADDRVADDVERRAVARRLDLERARVEVVRTRLAAGLAAGERLLPDVDAGVSFERESDGRRSTGPSVSLPVPLSGRGTALARAADAAAREAEDRLFDLAVRVRSDARESAAALRGAEEIAARYRTSIVPLRAATVEEAQLRYNGMLIGVYDLLAEKREELRARRDAVDAVRDARLARIRLELALGGAPAAGRAAVPVGAAPADEPAAPARTDAPTHVHGGK